MNKADRKHLGPQAVLLPVVFPHRHEILGTNDEGFQDPVVFEGTGKCRRHQGLAQANHVADQRAVAFVQVVDRDLHGSDLKIDSLLAEVAGNAKLGQTKSGLLGNVVGDVQVDMILRKRLLACPTVLDYSYSLRPNASRPSSSGDCASARGKTSPKGLRSGNEVREKSNCTPPPGSPQASEHQFVLRGQTVGTGLLFLARAALPQEGREPRVVLFEQNGESHRCSFTPGHRRPTFIPNPQEI
jgi:hypothetical protein